MFAVTAARFSADDPLSGLELGERPEPEVPDGWTTVTVKAASLNHHDLWSLRGVGLPADRLPMVLGCDAAGVDEDGNEVVVHAVIGDPDWRGDETLDPKRSLLSERHHGTFAERVAVPRRNLRAQAGRRCLRGGRLPADRVADRLPDAVHRSPGSQPGGTVLVQGAGGGVATALIALGAAAGYRVWATSRGRGQAASGPWSWAPTQVFETGARLPERVDAVMETVGAATWAHSLKSLTPGRDRSWSPARPAAPTRRPT